MLFAMWQGLKKNVAHLEKLQKPELHRRAQLLQNYIVSGLLTVRNDVDNDRILFVDMLTRLFLF